MNSCWWSPTASRWRCVSVEIDVLAGSTRTFSPKREFRRLDLRQLRVPGDVVVRRAELVLQRGEPLEVVADGQFLGHAHAAVQLDRLLAHKTCGPADRRLGGRYRARTDIWFRLEVEHREIHRGDGLLDFNVHVDHPVLKDLKAADRLLELLALFAVF